MTFHFLQNLITMLTILFIFCKLAKKLSLFIFSVSIVASLFHVRLLPIVAFINGGGRVLGSY